MAEQIVENLHTHKVGITRHAYNNNKNKDQGLKSKFNKHLFIMGCRTLYLTSPDSCNFLVQKEKSIKDLFINPDSFFFFIIGCTST